ncbi:MAG TPA: DUF5666 domain-containing protein [Solirubrobacterales bacterium]|nr:DUF5666 domain-containing protein [Solirubrobacterales bacterium]
MTRTRKAVPALFAVTIACLAMAAAPGFAGAESGSGLRSFHGKVRNVNRQADRFSIRNANGTRIRFRVNAATVFRHVAGLAGLSRGMRVEVKIRRGDDSRLARRVEAEGADDGTDDHGGGGHGANDPPGDDHGGGHGADD